MIGRLQGLLAEKHAPELLIDVNGVGYEVLAPMTTFASLGAVGEPATLYTHLVVRDDAHVLYGFASTTERTMFRTLIKVTGVGPKMALAILSGMDANAFANCIHNEDIKSLTKLPGVGKKTAERLIMEMRDRLKEWHTEAPLWQAVNQAEQMQTNTMVAEAESALVSLGYKPQDAAKMLSKITQDVSSSEELIRIALRNSLSK